MPQAAQATSQDVKGESGLSEFQPTIFRIELPMPGLLPERKRTPLPIYTAEALQDVPDDKKHADLRQLLEKLRPDKEHIAHLVLMPGTKNIVIQIQLHSEYCRSIARMRIESALERIGYPPKSAI